MTTKSAGSLTKSWSSSTAVSDIVNSSSISSSATTTLISPDSPVLIEISVLLVGNIMTG